MLIKKELDKLKKKLHKLSLNVEMNFKKAIEAMLNSNCDVADEVIKKDIMINELEIEVEEECLKVLALFQPVATDLRLIISILKINNDLERIGDLSKSIAKRTKKIAISDKTIKTEQYQKILECSFKMFQGSLEAFSTLDSKLAKEIILKDKEVDQMQHDIIHDLENNIDKHELPGDLTLCLFSFIHSVERIADLSVNIAEDIIYLIDGNIIRHQKLT